MIPKIIHSCWFGGGQKSPLMLKCIDSWKRFCPDYEIIEWNESNFDVNSNDYVKGAYEAKKYAFVSDYVRLYALYKFGGVYVDCDLEIRKNIDAFLHNRAFSGFETKDYIPTAIMGAEREHPWIKDLLGYYENRKFIKEDNTLDLTTNTKTITEITKEKYNLILNNKKQVLNEGIHIYPNFVLCSNVINSKNYSVHHFSGSWLDDGGDLKNKLLKYKKNYNIILKLLEKLDESSKCEFPLEGYDNIYIFGSGNITKYLVRYLKMMKYNLEGIISREAKEVVFGLNNIPIYEIGKLTLNDLIIVVPSYDFCTICDELSLITDAELISIEYLLGLEILHA